jgi:hypothetical protein
MFSAPPQNEAMAAFLARDVIRAVKISLERIFRHG